MERIISTWKQSVVDFFVYANKNAVFCICYVLNTKHKSAKKNTGLRAANNGRSTDNVRAKLGIDRTNPWIAGHLVRSFTDSFREILIFNYLIITWDNSYFLERKQNIKLDKLMVEKFAVVANFYDVIKSCRERKSSCLPLFYLL